jgi:phenylpyruvate tautomerase PptA (4-oxalocrotonate tautomerase family)
MPYLKLTTNVSTVKTKENEVLTQLSQTLARETGKPESYVMVELNFNPTMCFAGKTDPLAYLECKSIGLSPMQAKSISSEISRFLHGALNIDAARIYTEFSNCPGNYWGWNGGTFG